MWVQLKHAQLVELEPLSEASHQSPGLGIRARYDNQRGVQHIRLEHNMHRGTNPIVRCNCSDAIIDNRFL